MTTHNKALPTTQWRQIALLAVASFVAAVGVGAIYPYLPVYLNEEGGAGAFTIGIVAAAAFAGTAIAAGPCGKASDRLGRKWFILGGMAVSTTATFLLATSSDPVWVMLFRFADGVGIGMMAPATNALVGDLTEDRTRSRAYGILGTAGFGGLVIGPLLAVVIYEAAGGGPWGYRMIFITGGLVSFVVVALLGWKLRETVRIEPDGDAPDERPLPWRTVLTLPIIAFLIIGATESYSVGAFEVIWSLWLRDLGASIAFVGMTWTAFSLPMLLSFAGGWIADRTNRFVLLMLGFGVSAVVWVFYGLTTDLSVLFALCLIEGLAIALSWPAREAFLVQVSPPRQLGTVMGVEQTVIQVATVAGVLIAPLIFERFGGLTLTVGGLLSIVGLVVAAPVLGREWRRLQRQKGRPEDESEHLAGDDDGVVVTPDGGELGRAPRSLGAPNSSPESAD